jgi:hypothetical protein
MRSNFVLSALWEESPSKTAAWLTFVSMLIWQLLIVYFLWSYRGVLEEAFRRLSKLKVAGFEGEFQQQSSSATTLPPTTSVEIKNIDVDGFFTVDGLKQLIVGSGLLQPDEEVRETLLLFKTKKQRTWLASTDKSLFCVLDDANTRKEGRLIQWRQPVAGIRDIRAKLGRSELPVVDIGKQEGWLYSTNLHPDPIELENEIRSLLARASA